MMENPFSYANQLQSFRSVHFPYISAPTFAWKLDVARLSNASKQRYFDESDISDVEYDEFLRADLPVASVKLRLRIGAGMRVHSCGFRASEGRQGPETIARGPGSVNRSQLGG